MAILKHIVSKSSNYGAALEYLIFKHDELRKSPILDQNGNRIMRDEFYLDGLNCEPYSFDAACQQLNREYQKNKNKNSELEMEIAELDTLIEDLSAYMQSTGKKYADHAATLRSWSARKRKQQKPGTGIPDYNYNEEESL